MTIDDKAWSKITTAVTVVALATAYTLTRAEDVQAESPPPLCAEVTVFPDVDTIPSNHRSFRLSENGGVPIQPDDISVVRVTEDGEENVTISVRPGGLGTYILEIEEPLTEGADYLIRTPACGLRWEEPWSFDEARFRVGPAASVPTELGDLEVSQLYAANRSQGMENREYFVEVSWSANESVLPVVGIYEQHLQLPPGSASVFQRPLQATHSWRVAVACESARGELQAGANELIMFASPPEGDPEIQSNPATVEIDCTTALRVDNITLEPLTSEEIAYWDTTPPPVSEMGATRGSGCSTIPGAGGASGSLGLFFLVAYAMRRRVRA
jgi:hypothetical protein